MNSFLETTGWTLLHSIWEFLLIGLAVWLIVNFCCRTARIKYLVWCGGLTLLAFAPLLTFAVLPSPSDGRVSALPIDSRDNLEELSGSISYATEGLHEETKPVAETDSASATENQDLTENTKSMAGQDVESELSLSASNRVEAPWLSQAGALIEPYLPTLVLSWMIGATLLSIRTLMGVSRINQLRQTGCSPAGPDTLSTVHRLSEQMSIRQQVSVVESTLIRVPAVIGFFQPVILLPTSIITGLPANQLQAILAHELAHVRRHDYLVNLVQTVIEALFFYHPTVWWMSKKIREERENCCDDMALGHVENRAVFAKALLNLEECKEQPATLVAANGGSLLMRIKRLAESKSSPTSSWQSGLYALLVLAATMATPLIAGPYRTTEVQSPANSLTTETSDEQPPGEELIKSLDNAPPTETQDDVTPEGKATVSGKIQLADGNPSTIQGLLSYRCVKPNGNGASGNVSQPRDKFTQKIPSGNVHLIYYAKGFAPIWTEKFDLSDGAIKDDITFVLRKGFSVPLLVTSKTGEPIPNATIVAHPVIFGRGGGPIYKKKTDMAGRHLLKNVADTEYTFNVTAPGFQPLQTDPIAVKKMNAVKLELAPCRPSTGVVMDSKGKLVSKAKIRALHATYEKGSNVGYGSDGDGIWGKTIATTNENGQFNLNQLHDDAHYLLVVEGPTQSRVLVHDVRAGQKDLKFKLPDRLDLEVKVIGDVEQLRLANKSFAKLSVRQRVLFGPIKGHTSSLLLGGYSSAKLVKNTATYVLPGLAVDPNSSEPQKVSITIGSLKKTIDVNMNGTTRTAFRLEKKGGDKDDNDKAADEKEESDKLECRGIDLNQFPKTEVYNSVKPTCFIPLDGEFSIYYQYRKNQFLVRRDLTRESDKQVAPEVYKRIYYGPVPGNPIEILKLKPHLLEASKEFSSNARLAMAYMIRSDNQPLIETGIELVTQMLLDEEILDAIRNKGRNKLQAELNLDFAINAFENNQERLEKMKIGGLDKLKAAISKTEVAFEAAMPEIDDKSYNEAGYLQEKLPADEKIEWGKVQDGMRVGVLQTTPVALSSSKEPHVCTLFIQNKSEKRVYFQLEGHFAEWVRVLATGVMKKELRVEAADTMVSTIAFPLGWKLDPGEKLEVCKIKLTSAGPEERVKNTGIRGWKTAAWRIRANPGTYNCQFKVPVNRRRGIRSKGEWHGTLNSAEFNVNVGE